MSAESEILRSFLESPRRDGRPRRYAYLGPEATFTEAALRSLPEAAEAERIPFPTVAATLGAVRDGMVEAAMAPLENSVEGPVPATLAELVANDLHIVAETHVRVEFTLIAASGARLDDVRTILSHPHALAQCGRWLRQWLPNARQDTAPSTAAAARSVAEAGARSGLAAIAAPLAAERYRLEVLAVDIGDRSDAVTRFVLLRRPGPPAPRSGVDRTSILAMADKDHPGWLRDVLESFASRGVPVTRIDPRPSGDGLGRYHFLIDCEGHVLDRPVEDALKGVEQNGAEVRFLGSYPRDAWPLARACVDGRPSAFLAVARSVVRRGDGVSPPPSSSRSP
jgi:prephenate dehydratase